MFTVCHGSIDLHQQNVLTRSISSTLYTYISLLRPKHPRRHDQYLHPPGNPQHRLHPPRDLRDPPPDDSTDQDPRKRQRPPIPLHVLPQRARQLRVGRDIIQHARDHDGRDLAQVQVAAPDQLPRRLEAQQRDRDLLLPVDGLAHCLHGAGHHAGLDQRRGDEDEDGLQQEGGDEGAASERAQEAAEAGEEECAEDEADDGGERFRPAVGFVDVLGGGAQTDEDGVTWEAGLVILAAGTEEYEYSEEVWGVEHTSLHGHEGAVCCH